jgi:multidrug efflux pump subunit AcrA (membrane-fusion protein)
MSKVWIAVVILIAAAGAGAALYLRSADAKPASALPSDATTATVTRGDVTQSVTASGPVASNLDVLIKCRASGLVTDLPVDISSSVKNGDLLMQLDTKDEDVLVKQATENLLQAQSKVKEAISNERMAELDLATATQQADTNIEAADIKATNLRKKSGAPKNIACPEHGISRGIRDCRNRCIPGGDRTANGQDCP